MCTISFINYKDGAGKTTLTANLGAELAFRGYQVLLIDLDPQANLTFFLISPSIWDNDYRESKTIKTWFEALTNTNLNLKFADLIIQPSEVNKRIKDWSSIGSASLVCSHLGLIGLIGLDTELAILVIGANPNQSALNFLQTHNYLRSGLESISDDYDFIFFDCPANFNISTQSGIIASDFYIIPAIPDYLSLLSIDQLRIQVKHLIEDYNHYAEFLGEKRLINPKGLGVVFTMLSLYSKSLPRKLKLQKSAKATSHILTASYGKIEQCMALLLKLIYQYLYKKVIRKTINLLELNWKISQMNS